MKKPKLTTQKNKLLFVLGNDIIQDLLKVPEPDLFHQANIVDDDVKLIIQSQPNATSMSSPLHRFATFANLPAHYDCDFAPRNAGVYFNFEYFQLFLAYRDLEMEKQQQQNDDTRPILVQCRSDIEKVLVNTNWEAIRRRLTIGERIWQMCSIMGRGFLLLSKQVSGRKLLHNFNTGEWAEFMREFQRPENHTLLQTLQTKYSPSRFYGAPTTTTVSGGSSSSPSPVAATSTATTTTATGTTTPATAHADTNISVQAVASSSSPASSSSQSTPIITAIPNPNMTTTANSTTPISPTTTITTSTSAEERMPVVIPHHHDQQQGDTKQTINTI